MVKKKRGGDMMEKISVFISESMIEFLKSGNLHCFSIVAVNLDR